MDRALATAPHETLSDEQIVARIRNGDHFLFELLMRRHNTRVYRAVRSILKGEAETEDVMQQAYLAAFTHLHQYAGRAKVSTWLCRIAIHEALARVNRDRRGGRPVTLDEAEEERIMRDGAGSERPDPEQALAGRELARLVEDAVIRLDPKYRSVFMLREIDELSTEETAECLAVTEEVVKVRLHRARAMLKEALYAHAGAEIRGLFEFHRTRCDALVGRVMAKVLAG
jgi:RNA polymerase sigma-70 factor (ECF subfamily)